MLVELDYLPLAYYADNRITAVFFAANLLVHIVLFATLFALVQSLARALPISRKPTMAHELKNFLERFGSSAK